MLEEEAQMGDVECTVGSVAVVWVGTGDEKVGWETVDVTGGDGR